MDASDYIRAMRSFPGAVNVITTGQGDGRAGLTATAVMSLTAEPPQVAVAVNRNASAYPAIRANGTFCINTLGANHSHVASRFSGGAKGLARFDGGNWNALVTGAPALAEAVLNLDCVVSQVVELSTHDLLIGSVVAAKQNDPTRPLLYVDGRWASLLPGGSPEADRVLDVVNKSRGALDAAKASSSDRHQQLIDFAYRFSLLNIEASEVTQEYSKNEIYVDPEKLMQLNEARRFFDADVLKLVEDGVAEGAFNSEDSHITSFAILGMMIWTFRWYKPNGRLPSETIARQLAGMVSRMVGEPADAWSEKAAKP